MIGREELTDEQFCSYLRQISSIGIRPPLSQQKLQRYAVCFREKQYSRLIAKMMGDFSLTTRVSVQFVPDDSLAGKASLFNVQAIPLYGTVEFNRFVTVMKIRETMKNRPFEIFLSMCSHELVHILLFSLRHPLKNSEIATDLGTMALGFSETQKWIRNVLGIIPGYLNESQFKIAYDYFYSK